MKFLAPNESPAHHALHLAASQNGLDVDALRRLLWLVNAHPQLVAHAQVFEHLSAHLRSELCAPEQIAWAGDWQQSIPAWIDLCDWMVVNRDALSAKEGLEEFDRQAKHGHDNPHLQRGVTRHGVVACLWNRHESVETYPPSNDSSSAAVRYFQLQTQIFLTYAESRYRLSTLAFYEDCQDPKELPIAPAPTTGAGLAIREFSHDLYDPLLEQFPFELNPGDYSIALINTQFVINDVFDSDEPQTAHTSIDARRYLETIRRYFRRFRKVLMGWKPSQTRRRGGGGGGGHERRPGFIHFKEVPGVFLAAQDSAPDDADIPYQQVDRVWINQDEEADDDYTGTASGLAPQETLEALLNLYQPEALSGRLNALRYQRLAIEMQAQFLPYAYSKLTALEVRRVYQLLEEVIETYLQTSESISNFQLARRKTIAALILKVMLVHGQSLERARQLRFEWVLNAALSPEQLPMVETPTFLVAGAEGQWDNSRPAGICMPAIGPNYKTQLPDELDEVNRPLSDAILLPDLLGLGRQLHQFLQLEKRPNGRVFGIDPIPAKSAINELLNRIKDDRISPEKISGVLPSILMQRGADITQVWMVTADQTRADETRMHYTRHAVTNLQRAYGFAARRLARMVGSTPDAWTAPEQMQSEDVPSVGARFVIRLDELKSLVHGLVEQLREPRRTPFTTPGIRRYHDAYLLYTWLMQSLQTSIRAVTRPNTLYQTWHEAGNVTTRCGLSDKDSRYCDKARLASLDSRLEAQFGHYKLHLESLVRRLGLINPLKLTEAENLPLLVITAQKALIPLTPAWVESQLEERFTPLPANFHRAFLRTELLERRCNPETIDAFLGHADAGQSPYGRYATYDYGLHSPQVEKAIAKIHEELGLIPIPSRIVPHPTRMLMLCQKT